MVNSVPRTKQHLHRSKRLFLNSLVILAVSKVRVCSPVLWGKSILDRASPSKLYSPADRRNKYFIRRVGKDNDPWEICDEKFSTLLSSRYRTQMEFDIHSVKRFFPGQRTPMRFPFISFFVKATPSVTGIKFNKFEDEEEPPSPALPPSLSWSLAPSSASIEFGGKNRKVLFDTLRLIITR